MFALLVYNALTGHRCYAVTVFSSCRARAEAGDIDAAYNLGVCYEEGRGVGRDPVQAFEWYAEAAGGGDADALFSVGVCYHDAVSSLSVLLRAGCWEGIHIIHSSC